MKDTLKLVLCLACSLATVSAQAQDPELRPSPNSRFATRIAQQPPAESEKKVDPLKESESRPETTETDSGEGPDETGDLAKAAQNPVASMISVPFQFNRNFGVGPQRATSELVNIQPVIPVSLDEDWNLINRAILPLQYLPVEALVPSGTPLPGGPELGLGDLNYTSFISPSKPGRLIWGIGPTVTLPTATSTRFGTGKLSLGASAVGLTVTGPWVVGALVSQQWSVAGDATRDSVSSLLIQPFINYNLPEGWYLTSSPVITAN